MSTIQCTVLKSRVIAFKCFGFFSLMTIVIDNESIKIVCVILFTYEIRVKSM